MSLAAYSPALLLLYVWFLLCMTMDVRFRDFTPTQKWLVPLLVAFVAAVNEILYMSIGTGMWNRLIPLIMHLPYFLLFLHLTEYGVIKTAFMILTALVFSAPIAMVTTYGRYVIPLDSPLMLLSSLAACALMLLLARLIFRRGFRYLLKYGGTRPLLLFCLVPLLYYIYVFAVINEDLSRLTSVNWIIIRALPTVNVYVFYFLLLYNYRELSRRHELETAQATLNWELNAMEEQLALLDEAQSQSAIYRHDMRHHLTVISGFLTAGDLRQAEDYVQKVCGDIESVTIRRFCKNRLVDLLCSFFANRAEQKGVRLTVEAGLPEAVPLSDTEMCAIISNGLENALNAAGELEGSRRWTEFYCGIRTGKLLIKIRNPYRGEITLRDGLPVSGAEGHGYGCRSIRAIAERHQGLCAFQPEDGIFTLRIVLPM